MKAAQLELPMALSRVLAEPTSDAMVSKLEIVAQSQGGVGALRRLILGLALHGRLLQALDGDGHAGRLLRRTTKKASDPSVGRPPEEALPTLPPHWVWAPVGEIADCVLGKMLDKSKHTSGTRRPYLRNLNVRWGGFDLRDLLEMYFEDSELERYAAKPGDVLVCEGGEPGRAAVWTEQRPVLIQKAIHRIRLGEGILPHWLVMNLRYDTWTGRLERYFTGATIKHFTGRALEAYSIRLPPTLEQKRIVTKVDQLMALCDELEAKQTRKRDAGDRLTKAALGALTSAESPEELASAWRRIGECFTHLIDGEDAVSILRESVMRLACQGGLVRSDPGHPPVAIDIERLRKDESSVVRRGVPEKVPENPKVLCWRLPQSWMYLSIAELLRIGELTDVKDGNHGANHPLASEYADSGLPFIMASNVRATIDYVGAKKIPPDVANRLRVGFAEPGDVIYTHKGTIGRAAINTQPCILTPQTTYYRLRQTPRFLLPEYLLLALKSPQHREQVDAVKEQTTRDYVPVSRQYEFFIPLPPLDEQRRIVARVEQLMKLCDDLEAKLRARDEKAARLAAALVAEAIA